MEEISIKGRRIRFKNPDQIINMGGPWVGELHLDEYKLTDFVIIDNLLHEKDSDKIYFVKYHQISNRQKDNYFSVNYYDFLKRKIFMFDKKFDKVFIVSITTNNVLNYYEAFYDMTDKTYLKELTLSF